MIWLAWRQHRLSLLAGAATIAAVGVLLLVSGKSMRADFTRLGLDACAPPTDLSCTEQTHLFLQQYSGYQLLVPFFLLLPALVGVFWGAPLVAREVEQGTHRLVWTQSISRRRWLATKVTLLAVAAAAGLAIVTWSVHWWVDPLMTARPQQFDPGIFDLLGVMPAVYGLAALSLGIAAGTLTRKLVPAIALTLVVFLVLRVGVEFGMRPHYMEPVRDTFALPLFQTGNERTGLPPGWMLSVQTVDKDGRLISEGVGIDRTGLLADCPELAEDEAKGPVGGGVVRAPVDPNAQGGVQACAERFGFHVEAVYQPADRLVRFQVTEAILTLLVAAAALAASAWWISRRVT